MNRTPDEWMAILTELGVKPVTAAIWAPIFAEVLVDGALSKGDDELDDFLGQVLHESGMLEHLEEGLYYSQPERICAVWPSRFPTVADARPYARNPEALANRVYGGRMGNTAPGDGWRYRGSGLIQCTGADNLRALQEATGIPVYDQPDLLRKPTAEALQVCVAWWEKNIPDNIVGDVLSVTKRVNGGTIGLADRQHLTDEAREALA
jgi:putative chitinase